MEQTIRVEAMLAAATSPGDIPQSQLQESGLKQNRLSEVTSRYLKE
jgi:hypothetical protein